MELIIFLILLVIVIAFFRDIKFVVYFLGILEIFFRIIHYLGDHITFININTFINNYIPTSLFAIINKYTVGIVNEIMSWVLVAGFILFLVYLVKYFFKIK